MSERKKIEASFSTLAGAQKEELLKRTKITDAQEILSPSQTFFLDEAGKKVTYTGDFSQVDQSYTVQYDNDRFTPKMNWRLKDEAYRYDGTLGARLHEGGKKVDLTLWSPSADKVSVVIYDKNDSEKLVGRVALEKGSEALGSRPFLLIQDWIFKIIRAISTSMKLNAKGRPLPSLIRMPNRWQLGTVNCPRQMRFIR